MRAFVFACLGLSLTQQAIASPSAVQNIVSQPPSAPPALSRRVPKETLSCTRQYVYQGKTLDCDSNLARDAENLRPVFQEVPAALKELDLYQATRRQVRGLAYTSTIGLVLIVTGYLLGREIEGLDGIAIRNAVAGSGLVLTTGSVVFGFVSLRANEARLDQAIRLHNEAKPDRPIELLVTTSVRF